MPARLLNMARKRIFLPAGYGGLIRYPVAGKEKIKLKPEHLVWITIILIISQILLRVIL